MATLASSRTGGRYHDGSKKVQRGPKVILSHFFETSNPYQEYAKILKEIYAYITSFRDDEGDRADGSHPATLILELLAEQDSILRCAHLQTWYQEYAAMRGMPYLFKPVGQDTLKLKNISWNKHQVLKNNIQIIAFTVQSFIIALVC